MLTRLSVNNYALIDHLEVEFDPQLNIITGQTGAGKSILLGALSLLLGARNEGAAIKDNSRNCVVEAEFDLSGLQIQHIFEQEDVDFEPQIIIRRIITPSGKSRAYIGDQPVQLSTLKSIGDYLIDIHSQHKNLILTSDSFRIEALDTIADCGALRSEYNEAYNTLCNAKKQLQQAIDAASQAKENREWIEYQVSELRAAALKEGEEEELEAELATLSNAETITESYGALHSALTDEQTGILTQLIERAKSLKNISAYYTDASQAAERLGSVIIELQDLDSSAELLLDKIESDPERLDLVGARLELIYNLRRKHRAESLSELINIYNNYSAQLQNIESADENIAALTSAVESAKNHTNSIATAIYAAHSAAAPAFERNVEQILAKVGMESAQFKIDIQRTEPTAAGAESIEFLFSANKGIAPRAIEKIASGGEMSRVMLALKAILAGKLALPTIIFDEIDTGVSGSIANAVGEIIASLACSMQVINITHLPQVASKGNNHLVVYKSDSTTNMRRLNDTERITEIAKMLSGDQITEAAIAQAQILLGKK